MALFVPDPPSVVLDVQGLMIRIGKSTILNDLTFSVRGRSTLAVIGPNGSGKTVLFRALIGALPFEGQIRWAAGVRLGYVPQKLDLARDIPITGFDFLRARNRIDPNSSSETQELLRQVGLTAAAASEPVGAMSGGQFQRLLVAFALLGNPTVLLLDEPTSGIDEPGQERLNELLHRLQVERGLTIVLISHELTIVNRYADAVLCLGHGRAWLGSPEQVLTEDRLRQLYETPMVFHQHGAHEPHDH